MNKVALTLGLLALAPLSHAFDNFDAEAQKATKTLGCSTPKISGKAPASGRLYMCIGGAEQTVKYFINEQDGSTAVRNVKFLWVDYTKDVGNGLHTDAALAKAWASSLATQYAPTKVEAVLKAFASKKAAVIDGAGFKLTYTYQAGPAAAERMIVVTK